MGLRRVLKINAPLSQKRHKFPQHSHLQFFELLDDTVLKTFNSWKNCFKETL